MMLLPTGHMRMLQFTQVHPPSKAYARARSLSQDLSDSTWPPTPIPERLYVVDAVGVVYQIKDRCTANFEWV
jgi:hypothetical protein